jgi:anti-anti-sigma regulatory factor
MLFHRERQNGKKMKLVVLSPRVAMEELSLGDIIVAVYSPSSPLSLRSSSSVIHSK